MFPEESFCYHSLQPLVKMLVLDMCGAGVNVETGEGNIPSVC